MVGDVYKGMASVSGSAYLEVRPASGVEVVIHNIYHADNINLKLVDSGANELDFYDESNKSVFTNVYLHLTNDQYLRIYNTAVSSQFIAYDGIITKE